MADPHYGEVDLKATGAELAALAEAVAEGAGFIDAVSSRDDGALAGVEVGATAGPGVRIDLDARRRVLMISGDAEARAVLADNLHGMAVAEDGGHLHVDYFPDHPYLVEGSLPLIVNSPHGGMPRR
ncbi:hypothetical protein AB0I28_30955 [Phytomonospora sp. NPDC050363]|uniref:Imm32 family immunity protein n=1 Tax=Phytomonospora sp. NPDC050363 TaxID=3155642 RepID=UPI0033C70139